MCDNTVNDFTAGNRVQSLYGYYGRVIYVGRKYVVVQYDTQDKPVKVPPCDLRHVVEEYDPYSQDIAAYERS